MTIATESVQNAPARVRSEENSATAEVTDVEMPGFTVQTVSGIFDSAFDLYKRHFATLALIVACVFIPTQVILHAAGNLWLKPLMAHINSANPDPLAAVQVGALAFVTGAPQFGLPGYLSLLTSFMASGPVAVAVAYILVGRPLTVASAYRRAVPIFWRLFAIWNLLFVLFVLTFVIVVIGLSLGLTLIILGLTALSISPNAFGSPEMGVTFTILMIVLPYIASCILATMLFALTPPLIGLENLSVMSAVERNSRLVGKKHFWRVCLTVTMLPIVTFSLQVLILASASSVVQVLQWPAWAEFVIGIGLSSLISFFFQPYWMIFITLLYFDLRVRKEGLDVRYLADNLTGLDLYLGPHGADEPAAQSAPGATPPPLPPSLPNSPAGLGQSYPGETR